MKVIYLIIIFCIFNSCHVPSLHEKYPNGLLSEDYGILSEADLLKEIKNGSPRPYKTTEMQYGYNRWQCFPMSEVKFEYEKWRAPDPMGRFDIIVDMCDFSFEANQQNKKYLYHDRRARRLEFCKAVEEKWKKLTKGQTHICFSGDFSLTTGNRTSWFWVKYKTKLGCDSLFEGECETP